MTWPFVQDLSGYWSIRGLINCLHYRAGPDEAHRGNTYSPHQTSPAYSTQYRYHGAISDAVCSCEVTMGLAWGVGAGGPDSDERRHDQRAWVFGTVWLAWRGVAWWVLRGHLSSLERARPEDWAKGDAYDLFFAAAALALAAFFRLLRIMTTPRKEPTTAEPRSTRITGMRMAQTRGGKTFWRGWSESTKGWVTSQSHGSAARGGAEQEGVPWPGSIWCSRGRRRRRPQAWRSRQVCQAAQMVSKKAETVRTRGAHHCQLEYA